MVLDVAAVWTRMLSVAAGASAATGAPGPATRVGGKAAQSWIEGPWLCLIDFDGVKRAEREVLEPWLFGCVEPLLLVRNLLLARPLTGDVFVELTPQALEMMPEGWRNAPRPILILVPAGRGRPERRRELIDALSRLRIPLTGAGAELWAIREFDVELAAALALLSQARERAGFRACLDPSQRHLFDQQLPAAEAAFLDDLAGGRDQDGPLALDLDSLSSLEPRAHPLAVYAAVERAHNRRRAPQERTWYSARTIAARLSARGFPDLPMPCTPEFAHRAEGLLPGELQRVFEAAQLLAGE